MDEEKWTAICSKEIQNLGEAYKKASKMHGDQGMTPESWYDYKEADLNFIRAMDEATEVYNMENKEK